MNDPVQPQPTRFMERVILVSGGGGDLGLAISERLRREGARVAIADLSVSADAKDSSLVALQMDATQPGDWERAVRHVLDRWERLDGLVQCVGMLGLQAPVIDLPLETWEGIIRVNLTTTFLGLSSCLPTMVRSGYGRIVNIASIAGKEGNPLQAAYSASKAGVIALTKAAAREVATSGVTINCIAPSMIQTGLIAQMEPATVAELLGRIPMRRLGTPEELASLTSWILSEESSYHTGQCFDLSGGRAVY